ncbi:hypothetical protein HDZ31DRAFT_32725 [Schizophyllum fasciatum]
MYLGDMHSARDFTSTYIDAIPEVDLSVFLNHYMPPRTVAAKPATIAQELSQRWRFPSRPFQGPSDVPPARAPLDTTTRRWAQFAVDPKAQGNKESAVYSAFEEIFDQIVSCCREIEPHLQQTTKYFNEGDGAAWSTKSSSSHRDADIRLRWPDNSFDSRALYSHAVTIQLKKAERDRMRVRNSRQLNWELLHMLRAEPGRRFVLGMTVENRSVRLWHFNREIAVVSTIFDFQQNYEDFIDVFARFAFASPHQLGYDPTFIKGVPLAGNKWQNDEIVINNTHYELLEVIENDRADAAIGRCSWLWGVKDPSTGEDLVIKDCWMEDDRLTEFEILEDIRKRVRVYDWKGNCVPPPKDGSSSRPFSKLSELDRGRVDPLYHDDNVDRTAYFVNIIYGEKVMVDGQEDNTRTVMARGHELPPNPSSCVMFRIAPREKDRQRSNHMSGTTGHESQEIRPLKGIFGRGTNARAHHRIIMARGEPLDKITNPATALRVLRDASYGMFVMHCVGYLHRDPSAPNILLSHNGLGVLADIEYAKHMEDASPSHVGRTGTANYIALEVLGGYYLFENDDPTPRLFDGQLIPGADAVTFTETAPRVPWRLCELHDIESMFWIALWILCRHTLSCYSDAAQKGTSLTSASRGAASTYDIEAQRRVYQDVFPGQWGKDVTRRGVLCGQSAYDQVLRALPPEFQLTGYGFAFLRQALASHYAKNGERKIHGALWHMLYRLCAEGMVRMPQGVELVPLSSIPLRGEKRLAEGDASDAADAGKGKAEGPSKLQRKGT